MNKKGQVGGWIIAGIVLVLVVLGYMAFTGDSETLSFGETSASDGIIASCGDDGQATVTATFFNALNTTGSENYTVAYRIYDAQGNSIASDSTPASQTLNCGETVIMRMRSADGNGGDNARILNAEGSVANLKIIEGGRAVSFVADKNTASLDLYGTQHGVLEFRVYDNNNAGFVYDDGDASATNYETDGVNFKSTTDNATDTALGVAGEIDFTIDVRTTGTDTEFNDLGVYILVEAPNSVYDEPTVKFEGSRLTDVKGELDTNEARTWSGYEYVYFIEDASIQDDGVEVDFVIQALAGVNPADGNDLEVDFATRGAVKEVAGSGMIYSGTNDASSATVIFAVQDITLDIS